MGVERVDYSSDGEYKQALEQKYDQEMLNSGRQPVSRNNKNLLRSKAMEHGVKPLILKCKKCDLCKTKKNYVLGKGNTSADIFFVGEAPGKEEDEQGKPFVGNAGTILDLLLEEADFDEEDYYISNILKCRPPNNRNPEKNEIKACLHHLINEISVIQPKYIVCLGNYAVKTLFDYFGITNSIQSISKIHGELFEGINPNPDKENKYKKVNLIPMYHPAAGLYKPELRSVMLADMNRLYIEINYQVKKQECDIPF